MIFTIQLASKLLRSNPSLRPSLLPLFLSYLSAILIDSREEPDPKTFQWPALLTEAAAVSVLKLLNHCIPTSVTVDQTSLSYSSFSSSSPEVSLFSLLAGFLNIDFSQPSLSQQVHL